MRDRVFLAGAGVSLASRLPDGATFAKSVFDLLIASGSILARPHALDRIRAALQYELRLETFLEILAAEVSAEIAFQPFASLQKAEPSFSHFAIITVSRGAVITTNQDILFERAIHLLSLQRRIVHLHGRCDQIPSIVTIISQYLGGLDRSVRRSFQDAIRGKHVVVIGYSGRDRDVMPVLVGGKPKRIEWLLHSGSAVSPELERARSVLADLLEIRSVDTGRWLESQLSCSERAQIDTVTSVVPVNQPAALRPDWFEPITFLQRNKSIAKLLEHLGAYGDAAAVYEQLCHETQRKDSELILDFGRVTARVEGNVAARKIFRSIARRGNPPPPVRAQVLLEHADALRNESRPREARRILAQLERLLHDDSRTFSRKALLKSFGWLQSARAGIDRLEGRVNSARHQYAEAQRAFSRARDIGGHIDALTWQAETALIAGDVRKALKLSDAAICDSVAYASNPVKAWPWYVKAEGLILSGYYDQAADLIERAHSVFEAHGNIQGTFWTLISKIDCLKERSWRRAQRLLDQVWKSFGNRSLAHVRARLFLEQADLARAADDWRGADTALSKLRFHLRNRLRFSRQPQLLETHARLVEAECARCQGSADAAKLLVRAYKGYEKLGAESMAARAAVALVLAGDGQGSIKKIRAHCLTRGYNREVRALDENSGGYYPIQFI